MKNFIKGIFVGIFNIVPGLSGSALLIILGLYEKCLNKISTLFKNPKENFKFLFPIAIGIILGTYSFSKIIYLCLDNYPKETYIIFTGFLLGTIPNLLKESTKKGFKKRYLIPFFITLTIGILILFIKPQNINCNTNSLPLLNSFLIGTLLSISTIIPGISSTVLLSLFNLYETYIYSISILNLNILIPIALGLIITTFLLSKLITYLLNNYYGLTYFAILGFTFGSIFTLIDFNITLNINIIISIIFSIKAFIITNIIFKTMK